MAGLGTLVVERDGAPVLELRLDRGRTVLGSHPTSDVVLPGDGLPAVALVLLDTGERFRIRRLDPTLDLPVGDDDEADIEPGTRIALGDHVIRFDRRDPSRRPADRTRLLGETSPSKRRPPLELSFRTGLQRVPPDAPFGIGTDPANDLVIEDPFVSAFHCRLVPRGTRWMVIDLDSTNGTFVGGLEVREAELPARGELVVGRTALTVRIDTPEDESGVETFGMLGDSPSMKELFARIERLAKSDEPVLVTGESGTGKELVARALHHASGRAGPFLALNCGALSEALVESELFGHVKGAFTGAASDRPGAFEATQGGTLFLDEIGELPLALQPKLLRALETAAIRPVGGTSEVPVDVRIIAATHRDLESLVGRRAFREDLFHRLFVLAMQIPPLRDRPEDILPLCRHFLARQPGARTLSPGAEAQLRRHTWPGNVRELRNVIIRALYSAPPGPIEPEHLHFCRSAAGAEAPLDARRQADLDERNLRAHMLDALEQSGGNRSEAARLLGVSKSTFFDRLRRFGIG